MIPLTLAHLLSCNNRTDLRAAWLALDTVERAEYRWNETLAAHAWSVLKRTR